MTATRLDDEGSARKLCSPAPRPFALTCLLVLLAAGALACASPATPGPAATAPRLGRVIVVPLNLGLHTPSELRDGEAAVWSELIGYLRAQDRSLAVVEADDALALWGDALDELADSADPVGSRAAASRFAQLLAEHVEYDVVVIPSLVIRRARVGGNHASWDGVRRPLPVRTPLPIASAVDTGLEGVTVSGFKGSIAAASLHVAMLGADGEPLYEGLAGLDVIQELTHGAAAPAAEWTLAPRGDSFADASGLREGVERAFARRAPVAP
jgi:hypothetical protein